MTIAEKIRQATDEELAHILVILHEACLLNEVETKEHLDDALALRCLQEQWKDALDAKP